MRYIFFLLLLFSKLSNTVQGVFPHQYYDPLLVVVIMVKNEADVMEPTLQPFVDAGIHSFFIFDTGSTDDTIEITKQIFEKNNIHNGYITQEPFVDFATSRNRALELTEQQFPNAAFLLMIDAEWYMQNVEGLLEFCKQCITKDDNSHSYLIRLMYPSTDTFYTARLIRCNHNMRFVGVVHEVLDPGTAAKVSRDVYIQFRPRAYGLKKTKLRFIRDRDLLLQEYYKKPFDPRTAYYLAQTYASLGDWHNAIQLYDERTDLHGFSEEDFMAWYRLGECIEHVLDSDPTYQWQDAMQCYLEAFQMRPTRAEPLVRIAQYYWDTGHFDLCYLFAKHACEIPFPKDDILGVIPYYYDYVRYDLLGRRAWYAKQFELGEWAINKALESYPDKIHLHKNLDYYVERRKHEFLGELQFES